MGFVAHQLGKLGSLGRLGAGLIRSDFQLYRVIRAAVLLTDRETSQEAIAVIQARDDGRGETMRSAQL